VKIPTPKKLSVHAASAETDITCYPNPAKQMLSVRVSYGADSPAELVDALGRVMDTKHLYGSEATFDVSELPDGIYFMRLGATARKIIVSK
jgi:hypothetical protein